MAIDVDTCCLFYKFLPLSIVFYAFGVKYVFDDVVGNHVGDGVPLLAIAYTTRLDSEVAVIY